MQGDCLRVTADFCRIFVPSWQKNLPPAGITTLKRTSHEPGSRAPCGDNTRLGMEREIPVYTVDYWLFPILPEVWKTCLTLARAGIAADLLNVTAHRTGGGSGPDKCVPSPSAEQRHPTERDIHGFRLQLQPMQI